MNKRLNCFISYYHKDDFKYVKKIREIYQLIKVSDYGLDRDISYRDEEQIYDRIKYRMNHCSVTIVLIGKNTGRRKWVDWEIWASLEGYRNKNVRFREGFRPSGILAIFLPGIKKHSIPKRLQDNIDSGYVVKMDWNSVLDTKNLIRKLVIANRMRKNTSLINNTRNKMKNNSHWLLELFDFEY
ncbi:TIR domain-containing protein [uncultured Kordia sp.]|uniref:TIR domain-containing protein n=1 Tax=uncultured Kordia sp. TaxID=507699 RepID=UPI002606541A|nr:TIR domain-containing protein [uncultured Kordia sp.]